MENMPEYSLIYYIVTCIIAAGTPGPGTLAVLNTALRHGMRKTLPLMIGIVFGMGVVSIATVTGLSTLILHSDYAFSAIKYLGGLYIGYLGVISLIPLFSSPKEDIINNAPKKEMTFVTGIILSIFNPKTLVFFIALLPTFINQQDNPVEQTASLTLILLLCTFSVHLIYSRVCSYVSNFLTSYMKWVDGITGLIFITFSIAVLFFS